MGELAWPHALAAPLSELNPCGGRPKASNPPNADEPPPVPDEEDTQPSEAGVRIGEDTGENPPCGADDGANELNAPAASVFTGGSADEGLPPWRSEAPDTDGRESVGLKNPREFGDVGSGAVNG